MEISEFTLKLIIILAPGGLASIIYEKLTVKKKWSPFHFVANSIILGGISYLLAQFVLGTVFCDTSFEGFWDNLSAKEIPFEAIMKATGFAIVIGFIGAALDRYKIVNRFATGCRLSNKYGDENLFTYFMNGEESDEVYIRDLHTNQTYHGMVLSFSETDEIKEMVLSNVKVYEYKTSKYLYDIDYIYLARSKDLLTLEVNPVRANTQSDDKEHHE